MTSQSSPTRKNIQDLLFNPDPEQRRMAAEGLGRANLPIANEGDALEALTMAMHDRHMAVQETAFQSLVRLSV